MSAVGAEEDRAVDAQEAAADPGSRAASRATLKRKLVRLPRMPIDRAGDDVEGQVEAGRRPASARRRVARAAPRASAIAARCCLDLRAAMSSRLVATVAARASQVHVPRAIAASRARRARSQRWETRGVAFARLRSAPRWRRERAAATSTTRRAHAGAPVLRRASRARPVDRRRPHARRSSSRILGALGRALRLRRRSGLGARPRRALRAHRGELRRRSRRRSRVALRRNGARAPGRSSSARARVIALAEARRSPPALLVVARARAADRATRQCVVRRRGGSASKPRSSVQRRRSRARARRTRSESRARDGGRASSARPCRPRASPARCRGRTRASCSMPSPTDAVLAARAANA